MAIKKIHNIPETNVYEIFTKTVKEENEFGEIKIRHEEQKAHVATLIAATDDYDYQIVEYCDFLIARQGESNSRFHKFISEICSAHPSLTIVRLSHTEFIFRNIRAYVLADKYVGISIPGLPGYITYPQEMK